MIKVSSPNIKNSQGFLDEIPEDFYRNQERPESPDAGDVWGDFVEDNIQPEERTIGIDKVSPIDETPEMIEQLQADENGEIDEIRGDYYEVEKVFDNVTDGLNNSLSDKKVIKIDYTTIDGIYTPNRVIEPHRVFVAGTGREILLTWDLTVGDIRGFYTGNIKPGLVMYRNRFTVRPYIMKERTTRVDRSSLIVRKPN